MGAKRVIARLTLSLIGGTLLFLAVTVAGGVLSTYTDDHTLHHLLMLPARWPRYLYHYLSPTRPSLYFEDTASLVTLIACNIVLYGSIVYFVLWLRSFVRRRGHADALLSAPPPPPDALE
jgi:hypothetical protein